MSVLGNILTVERTLPDGVLSGLLTGQYSLHGGVIRNATGQIIRHLIPNPSMALDPFGFVSSIPDLFNTYQLYNLSNQVHNLTKLTEQVLAISSATMALSGLGLAVGVLNFATMNTGLKRVEKILRDIDKKLDWIIDFLDSQRKSRFLFAMQELSNLPDAGSRREYILQASREKLGETALHYLDQWNVSNDLMASMSHQHYFCISMLALAKCSAELDMHENAIKEFQNGLGSWQHKARILIKKKILNNDRSRFLSSRYLPFAPAAKIVSWLDFAYQEQRGYGWIDELRRGLKNDSSIFTFEPSWKVTSGIEEKRVEVSILDNLTQRNFVLQGYADQFKYLAEHKLRPSAFDKEANKLFGATDKRNMLILAPV